MDDPEGFWSQVKFDDASCALADVALQLTGFLAHTADLERAHSVLSWLQNKHRNSLKPVSLISLARVNRCLHRERAEQAERLARDATRKNEAAQRAAHAYKMGVDLSSSSSCSSSSSSSSSDTGSEALSCLGDEEEQEEQEELVE